MSDQPKIERVEPIWAIEDYVRLDRASQVAEICAEPTHYIFGDGDAFGRGIYVALEDHRAAMAWHPPAASPEAADPRLTDLQDERDELERACEHYKKQLERIAEMVGYEHDASEQWHDVTAAVERFVNAQAGMAQSSSVKRPECPQTSNYDDLPYISPCVAKQGAIDDLQVENAALRQRLKAQPSPEQRLASIRESRRELEAAAGFGVQPRAYDQGYGHGLADAVEAVEKLRVGPYSPCVHDAAVSCCDSSETRENTNETPRTVAGAAQPSEDWKTAALLKDRTRREMRSRAKAGDTPEAIAADWSVPLEFVAHLLSWQLFGDDVGAAQPDTTGEVRTVPALRAKDQEIAAQFAHNAALIARIEELEHDNDMYGNYLGRIEGIVNGTGSTGHIKWDLAERIEALVRSAALTSPAPPAEKEQP